MAAPSIPSLIGNSDGRRYKGRFDPTPLAAAGYSFGGEAAGNVDLSSIFGGIRANSYDPAAVGQTAAEIRIGKDMANTKAWSDFVGTAIEGYGQVEGYKQKLAGMEDRAQSAKNAAIVGAFRDVALGGLKLASGGAA